MDEDEFDLFLPTNVHTTTAATATTATPPSRMNLLELERCGSPPTASRTAKLVLDVGAGAGEACSCFGSGRLESRLSSRLGNGTGAISVAMATGRKGSATGALEPLVRAGAAAAVACEATAGP